MSAHTPGPWECHNGDQVHARPSVKLHHIATAHTLDYDRAGNERAANQRLIAAAPQLLEAAKEAAEVLSTIYAKYGLKIGPYSSQAQKANVALGRALAAAGVKP
jgi:hypothetical protein